MNTTRNPNSFGVIWDSILRESVKRGPVLTFLIMLLLSLGLAYLVFYYVMSGWGETNANYRQEVYRKELENKKTERLLAGEGVFRVKYDKIVKLYNEAKPLLPQETEVSDVLGQVETAAQRNGVTLTGLSAVTESIKSPRALQLYEREIPALVSGPYPNVVSFFADISRMPRILVIRDYSVISLRNTVSAGFTLVAYHAPPPSKQIVVPEANTVSTNIEVKK